MKKNILTFIFIFIIRLMYSQDLPKYYIVKGDTTGMTLSMSQVKKIKSDLELKSILENMKVSCDSLVNKSKNQEKECDERISSKDKIIYQMDTSIQSKMNRIRNLDGELVLTREDRNIHKKASQVKDSLNIVANLRLTEVKTQRNFFLGGTLLFLTTTILLFLFH